MLSCVPPPLCQMSTGSRWKWHTRWCLDILDYEKCCLVTCVKEHQVATEQFSIVLVATEFNTVFSAAVLIYAPTDDSLFPYIPQPECLQIELFANRHSFLTLFVVCVINCFSFTDFRQ